MLSLREKSLITGQLGKLPSNVVAVAAWCPVGHPSVVTCYPLRRNGREVAPFPTLYWLTCPHMCAQLSHLERDGAISIVENELANDQTMQVQVRRDHENYIARRWATLSPSDRELVSERGLLDAFQSRGIGGITNHATIKCLHLHVAHDLACGSAIGRRIAKRFEIRPCETD